MFQITVNTRRAIVGEKELITTSSAGIQVQFTFSEDWDGLAKFAIFRNGEGDESRVAMAIPSSGLVTLPSENCAVDYIDEPIFAGVYGNDGLGTTIIPTIWASMGVLREGASYEGAMPADPTPDMWAQILAIANEAHDTAEDCAEAEQLRAAAEELRVAAETARAAAEDGRVSAEEARATAENLRATAEDLRVTAENARSAAEQNRATAEAARAFAEASRQQNESTRQSNETARQTAESNRASAESTRASNEQARIQAETARADAEAARADAETARVLAESARVAAEQARVNAENARGTAESARASAEALRASAESARASAEAARATAESNRADTFANWTTTFNGWQSTLDGKADQSALDDLSDTVSNLNRQLSDETTGLDTKAPVILETVSGEIASFADGADGMPVKSLVANIEPVQDLHGYDYPWPDGGGVNKLEPVPAKAITNNGVTFTSNGDGTYSVSGTVSSGTATVSIAFDAPTLIKAGTYYMSVLNNSTPSVTVGFYMFANATRVWDIVLTATNKQAMVNVPSDIYGTILQIYVASAGTVNFTLSPVLSTDGYVSTFAPFANICPISGHTRATGQNTVNAQQWDEEWEVGAISVSNGSLLDAGTYMRSKNYIPVASGKTYYRAGVYMSDGRAFFYGQDKSFISHTTISAVGAFDIPYNACFMKFHKKDASYYNNISINYPATDTEYHPYTGNQISVTFPSSAGTVYGGTLDVTNGVLTVDRAMVTFDGTESANWIMSSGRTIQTVYTPPGALPSVNTSGFQSNVIFNIFKTITTIATGRKAGDAYIDSGYMNLIFAPNTFAAVADFKTWLNSNNLQVVYELANPVTYQLTPQELDTLLGTNNIWSDTGDVSIEYPCDTKLYIVGKIAEAIANALNA